MHTQRSHIINLITKGIYLLFVLLCLMLCTNVKAQENDTVQSQNTANGIIRPDYTFNFVIPQNPGFVYDSISGSLIVYDYSTTPPTEAGRQKLNEDGKPVFPMTVKDQAGNVYQLTEETDENGNTTIKSEYLGKQGTPLTSDNFDASKIDSDKAIVSFEKGAGQYAFDKFDIKFSGSVRIRDKYSKIGDYNVPWKFLPESGSDKIQAKVMLVDNSVNPENVMFQTPQGMLYEKKHLEGNTFEISAVAGVDNDVQQIYALYPTDNGKFLNLGRVDVVTYKPQTAKLVVVSVNGNATSTNELKAYLNDVYGKIGVTFEVETDTFTYNNAINFFDQSSGWFSRYTAAMKAFNIAYRNNTGGRYDSDKNYLFVLGEDVSRSDRDAQGFMPLGGRFGYLFKNQIPDNQINSIAAHELGHGVWALKHTFDNDYGNIAVNTTDNLMDYTPQANHLAKWQWEIIRYPALFTDPFGGDEEAMASSEIFEFEKVSGKINLDEIKYKKFIEEATLYYKAYNANGNNTSASNYLNKSLYIKLDGEIYKTNSVSTIFGRDRSDAYIGRFSGIYEIGEEEILQLLGQADYVFYDYGLTQVKEIVVYNESVGRDKLLDYKYEAYRILSGLYPNDLILIDGVVYNANEAGNYIWGMVLTYHGIFISPNLIAELGTRGRKDEPWEQRSITLGVEKADKEYINLPQQVKETILNYRLLFRSIYGEEDKTWRELNY